MRLIPFSRGFYASLPLGLGLPALTAAASVAPGDATSNLAKWASIFGITKPPQWLLGPEVDHKAIWIGAGLFAVYLVWVFASLYLDRRDTLRSASDVEFFQLGKCTNGDLKRITHDIANQLRTFQNGASEEFGKFFRMRQGIHPDGLDGEFMELVSKVHGPYIKTYQPKALALRSEMMSRLGRVPPYPVNIALDMSPAGPTPFSDLANYMERIAEKLP